MESGRYAVGASGRCAVRARWPRHAGGQESQSVRRHKSGRTTRLWLEGDQYAAAISECEWR